MILDYSQPKRKGPTTICCVRTLWSPTARVEFAQCASWAHAILVLTTISSLAALLTASNSWLHGLVIRGINPQAGLGAWFWAEAAQFKSSGRLALQLIPVYFAALSGIVYVAACLWWRSGRERSWSRCFAAASMGCVPLLWFFLLIQLECLAPLFEYDDLWNHHLNPLTNSVRFAVFISSLMLVAVWLFEAARLKDSVRYQR